MKALSFWQPWAWLIVSGHKLVENRTWRPSSALLPIGTRFAIHASKRTPTKSDFPDLVEEIARLGITLPTREQLVYGAVIGTVALVGFVTSRDEVAADQRGWFCGPVGWVLRDPRPLAAPIHCLGQRGIYDLPEDFAHLMEFCA